MARSMLRHTVKDSAGNVIQNALVYVYQQGTATPITDLFAASTGGAAIAAGTLVSDGQGDVIGWLTTPKFVDIKVTDNSNAAYYPSTPTSVLDWPEFTETMQVPAANDDVDAVLDGATFTGPVYVRNGPIYAVDAQPSWVAGAADNSAAYSEARLAAVAAGGGVVLLPQGDLNINARLTLSDKVSVRGHGPEASTVKVAGSGVTDAAIAGLSSATPSDLTVSGFTIDAGHGDGRNLRALQITSGARITIDNVRCENIALEAILIDTCTDVTVQNGYIADAGGDGGATGFGILFSGGSRNKALHNRLFNVAGMGIGGNTNCTDCEAVGNYIDKTGMAAYEGVGITSGCDRWTIGQNIIINSMDNGISPSSADNTIIGNIIDGCQFHGINGGNRNVIVGNRVRNPGKAVGEYAAIHFGAGDNQIADGNLGYDDQGSPTMRYGVRETAGAVGNVIGPNNLFYGYLTAEFLIVSASTKVPPRVRSKTGVYTAVQFETVLADGTFTVTLPGVAVDSLVRVKNSGSGTITVATPGAETIDGSASDLSLAAAAVASLLSDGTNWFRVGS